MFKYHKPEKLVFAMRGATRKASTSSLFNIFISISNLRKAAKVIDSMRSKT